MDRCEWHGIKGIFVDFTGLDHHAVKITKHKNPLYSDQYEPHGKKQSFLHLWYFNEILLNAVPFWTDVSNDRWGKDSVTLKCNKLEYRIDGSSWREAERTPEGDYQGGGSARVWYWSPLIQDLELIDAKSESYKMRVGRYDIRVDFEGVDESRKVIETTFTLGEKMVQHWTSVREILEELSGIN